MKTNISIFKQMVIAALGGLIGFIFGLIASGTMNGKVGFIIMFFYSLLVFGLIKFLNLFDKEKNKSKLQVINSHT